MYTCASREQKSIKDQEYLYLQKLHMGLHTQQLVPGVKKKKVYSRILSIIQKQYNVIKFFFHTLLTKCLFTCVQNFLSYEHEKHPVKLGFVPELPILCT